MYLVTLMSYDTTKQSVDDDMCVCVCVCAIKPPVRMLSIIVGDEELLRTVNQPSWKWMEARRINQFSLKRLLRKKELDIVPQISAILACLQHLYFKYSCPWCNCYRRRKWTRRHEFKSWTRLIAFHIALIPLGKVWIQLFSLQLWVNSRTE